MGSSCTVCSKRQTIGEIDEAISSGEPLVKVAKRYGVSRHALARHRDGGHLAPAVSVTTPASVSDPVPVLARVEQLIGRTLTVLDRAEKRGQTNSVLNAIKETRKQLELVAKIVGELDTSPKVAVVLHQTPEWREHVAHLLDALAPYPEIRLKVAQALQEGSTLETST